MSVSLLPYNSFAIAHSAQRLIQATSPQQIVQAFQQAAQQGLPVLVLGAGSNVLFTADFAGLVMVNRIMGIEFSQSADQWLIHAAAGENWHQLLEQALARNIGGLENLALIPGCVGSAPIQNIGAYGAEFKQFCRYVDCLEPDTGQQLRLSAEQCAFGYRDSIFKQPGWRRYVITAVGLAVNKRWQPQLSYGELSRLNPQQVTPRQLFDAVCAIRRSRLPDPAQLGNAGSFFKNPLVSEQQAQSLLARYPTMPHYPQADGQQKLAAGWLIDQCQLKGFQMGGAAVHEQQALVIVNLRAASSTDVVRLAAHIRQQVAEKFAVWLEPEVRFIGARGEINPLEMLS